MFQNRDSKATESGLRHAKWRWRYGCFISFLFTQLNPRKQLGLVQHPDKTVIGRLGPNHHSGFEFLGYFIRFDGVSLSNQALLRHRDKLFQLYEQGLCARDPRFFRGGFKGHPKAKVNWTQIEEDTIGYINKYKQWAEGGLQDVPFNTPYAGLSLA